jgi:hypothetical protein
MGGRIVHFLCHVPKCAGTTVEAHFRTHLGKRFLMAPRWDNPLRDVIGNRYPGLTAKRLEGVDVVSGHSLSARLAQSFDGAEVRQSVLLRDPLGFLLSFYNYRWARHVEGTGPEPPEFETWYGAQRRNPISRFLLTRYFDQGVPALYRLSSSARLEFLEERLANFHFVGSYKLADEMISTISRELGLPDRVEHRNVTPERRISAEDVSADLRARITAENALDQMLFERWAERRFSGTPDGPRPDLSSFDQPRYVVGDIVTALRKKLISR